MKNSLESFYFIPKVSLESLCLLSRSLLNESLNSDKSITFFSLSPSLICFFSFSFLTRLNEVSLRSLGSN